MIVVTGANGFIGKEFIKLLSKKVKKIRCLVLEGEDVSELKSYGVDIVYGDILNKDILLKITKDVESVVHLAGIVTSNDIENIKKVNVQGTINVINACKENNIKHVIFTSSIAAVAKNLGPYGKSKIDGEKIVKESGLDYTILRPTLVYGKEGHEFNDLVNLVRKLPLIPLIGGGKSLKNPLYVTDLANIMVEILLSEKSKNKTYEIGGSKKISFADLVDIICKELNLRKIKIYIPQLLILLPLTFLEIFTKKLPLTKDQVLALENDAVANMESLENDFDFKQISFEEGLKKSLA